MPMAEEKTSKGMRHYARLEYIRPVVQDGWYNAFTDLTYWKEMYWLCYRRGTNHGAGNSVEVVLRSNDLRRWREVEAFESPYGIEGGCAAADGHFCVTPDRLYIVIGTRRPTHSFLSYTTDGVQWSKPKLMQLEGVEPYFWRIRWRDGRFYSAANALASESEPRLDLMTSDNGIQWTSHAQIDSGPPPNAEGDNDGYSEESDVFFHEDGELWCVIRTHAAQLYTAQPPYTEWKHAHTLPSYCDAPVMCACGDDIYLAGRAAHSWAGGPNPEGFRKHELHNPFSYYPGPFTHHGTTGLYLLTRERADLLLLLPPAGDASYAGLISTEPGKLVLSYYSDVAYASGIKELKHFPEYVHKASECDIYVAGVEVGEHEKPWVA